MASYASSAELKAILRITDTDDDALIQLALDAATFGIDLATGGVPLHAVQLAVTGSAGTDTIAYTAHGLAAGTAVQFLTLVGGSGLAVGTQYYVVNPTANDFQVALTPGGAFVGFTTNVNAGSWLVERQQLDPVPQAAKLACTIQATRYVKRKDAAFGVLGSPEFGTFSRLQSKLDPDVEVLLDGLGERTSWGTTA